MPDSGLSLTARLARLRLLPDPGERELLSLIDERIDEMTPRAALFEPRRHDNNYPDAA